MKLKTILLIFTISMAAQRRAVAMELTQEFLQIELKASLRSNDVARVALYLAAGADFRLLLAENKFQRVFSKSMRKLLQTTHPDLEFQEPKERDASEPWSARAFIASQMRGARQLMRFGAGLSRSLLTQALGTIQQEPSAPAQNKRLNQFQQDKDLVAELLHLFLNDYEEFKQRIAYFPKDLRNYLARFLLQEHAVIPFLEAEVVDRYLIQHHSPLLRRRTLKDLLITYLNCDLLVKDLVEDNSILFYRLLNDVDPDGNNAIEGAAVNNSRTMIAYGTSRGELCLLDTSTGQKLKCIAAYAEKIRTIQFNKSDDFLVTASADKTVKIWQLPECVCIATLVGHEKKVNSAQFSPTNPELVVTASSDGTAIIWDFKKELCLQRLEGHEACVNSALFNNAGNLIVTASKDGTLRIWDTASGKILYILRSSNNNTNACFNPADSKIIAQVEYVIAIPGPSYRRHTMSLVIETQTLFALTHWLRSCSLEEALLLHCVFTLNKIDTIVAKKKWVHTRTLFNFERCPALREIYHRFPSKVQEVLAPYVESTQSKPDLQPITKARAESETRS